MESARNVQQEHGAMEPLLVCNVLVHTNVSQPLVNALIAHQEMVTFPQTTHVQHANQGHGVLVKFLVLLAPLRLVVFLALSVPHLLDLALIALLGMVLRMGIVLNVLLAVGVMEMAPVLHAQVVLPVFDAQQILVLAFNALVVLDWL